ncbi:MAG: amidohydrolase [Endomicrobium sp.]|nr:amidohydrolase [Endomicrobium sp.]
MNIAQEIIRIRRAIHQNPELSRQEYQTAKFIEGELDKLHIPHKRVAKTGVVGILKTGKAGKTIALRADIDALPIQEENNISYKSKNAGIMHACGHDNHLAIVLGAAAYLVQNKKDLQGNVKFIFQPSEEISGGAKAVLKAGAFKNPKVDIVLGAHVSPRIKSGKIGIKFGAMMASVDRFHIEILGFMAHGAHPHLGKDAITAAAEFILSVQTIVSREIDPLQPAVITLGKISGGDSYNIICKNISIDGTVRTLNSEVRKHIKAAIIKRLKSLALAHDIKYKLDYFDNAKPLINNQKIADFCLKTAQEFYGKNNVIIIEKPVMGGEDFSEYLEVAEGNFLNIGTNKNKQTAYPHHNSKFNVDEDALPKAAQYLAYTIQKLLKERCR